MVDNSQIKSFHYVILAFTGIFVLKNFHAKHAKVQGTQREEGRINHGGHRGHGEKINSNSVVTVPSNRLFLFTIH